MTSKDKDKTFEKLKQFFRIHKGVTGAYRLRDDFTLTVEHERDLSSDSSLSTRIKTMKELNEIVLNSRLEDNAASKFWSLLEDLLKDGSSKENRHFVFSFFRALIQGQYEKLGLMRAQFFNAIKNHEFSDDTIPRLELLQSLTDNGKDILYIEEEIGMFLLDLMPVIVEVGKELEFLMILTNVIKYNASYIDENIIAAIIQSTCTLCCQSKCDKVVISCLQVLDAIVCYSEIPSESLFPFVALLCRTVNLEVYFSLSWKIMRNLMGTHLGHSALCTMRYILENEESLCNPGLLRGSIVYISMGLWSGSRVKKLVATPPSILPSFISALRCEHNVVMYEVLLGVQRLVNLQSSKLLHWAGQLLDPSWTLIFTIFKIILAHIKVLPEGEASNTLSKTLHNVLTNIEELIDTGLYNGSIPDLFEIIALCSAGRPVSSIERIINFLASTITPVNEGWLDRLEDLLVNFYQNDTRASIRLSVLSLLGVTISNNRAMYERELTAITLRYLRGVTDEPEMSVRTAAAELLVDMFLNSEPELCLELVPLLEQVLNRALDRKERVREEDAEDIKKAAHGLVQGLTTSMFHHPPTPAISAYNLITFHLNRHYDSPEFLNQVTSVRYMMLECLVHLRADHNYRMGLVEHNPPFSMFLRAHDPPLQAQLEMPAPTTIGANPLMPELHEPQPIPEPIFQDSIGSNLNSCEGFEILSSDLVHSIAVAQATQAIVKALRHETDWKVMLMLLRELPLMLHNRALMVPEPEQIRPKNNSEIVCVATAICAMICDKNLRLPDRLVNTPPKFMRSGFQSYVFPVVASLIPYQSHLDPPLQQRIIKCLEQGLASRCAQQCVNALTICTLEMRDAMVKLLPEVLLNLSKISATVHIAIPILEFLSTLTQLPNVFANFVGDQYMSVFAISLPYTNPFKYNHYTVSLAHHVIAAWFLKCRLPFRKDFVQFIIKGLKANILLPFEEGRLRDDIVNEDSSNRKRSSSLTEQGSYKRVSKVDLKSPVLDNALMAFHKELTETCIDLMAMYTYSTCSPVPKRQSTAELLLREGKCMTWILGHKLITVTTSGCTLKAMKHGLCDRCYQICRVQPRNLLSKDSSEEKKSNKSENKSSESNPSTSSTGPNSPDEEKAVFPEPEQAKIDQLIYGKSLEKQVCACWCKGWAEILVQRPTGSMSWSMRLQNEPHSVHWKDWKDGSNADISTLFLPSKNCDDILVRYRDRLTLNDRVGSDPVSIPQSPIRRNTHHEIEDIDLIAEEEEGSGRSRNPVRRSNSSPEMSSNWKNPLLIPDSELEPGENKKKQNYSKDMRVNCEAIPEEIGTTPPTSDSVITPVEPLLEVKPQQNLLIFNPKEESSDPAGLPPLAFKRDRVHTISVMSPARKPGRERDLGPAKAAKSSKDSRPTSGVNPAFVFLQLYHSACFGCTHEKPMLLSNNCNKALKNLNWIPPYEIHKIGVLYVGPGQANSEVNILKNEYGSPRYVEFLQRLGTLINLAEADSQQVFLGGLQTNGQDGKFSYFWQDDVMQVMFHVATLMPNHPNDPQGNNKKLHIGNDFANIVYNDSGEEYNFQTLKAQCSYAVVVVEPLEHGTNQVKVQAKEELVKLICHTDYKVISDQSVAIFARQLALHCNLAATVVSRSKQEPYASNWLERLRQIKRIHLKTMEERSSHRGAHSTHSSSDFQHGFSNHIHDFTEYT